MANFAYTTGNPDNLVGGANAAMVDIQGPFVDLKAYINATLDVNGTAFTSYKMVEMGSAQLTAPVSTTFIMGSGASGTFADVAVAGGGSAKAAFWFDPAHFLTSPRTTKLRIIATTITNAVAPTVNFTVGMNPVATIGGGSGAAPTIATIGGTIAGSGASIATPAGGGASTSTGADFTAPAAGLYCLTVFPSGTSAAGSVLFVLAQLQVRQV